ncbi:MAG TPA: biopolymer transporter ExbD [Gemmatimonadota bacterium]|nr:biopolymer transporter ExbD [Gemmatimonadota bacterium]
MRLEKGRRRKALINVTSLIDVVFLLLIFFVVTSTFLERPGIDLHLPEAGSGASEVAEVSVRIAADGGLYVGTRPVAPAELTEVLEARLREAGTTEVTLEADRRVAHGRVVAAMDAARKAGATGLVVATRPEAEGEP